MNNYKPLVLLCILISLILSISGCFDKNTPPFITAEITDAAGNITVINNFKIIYWWEERNETPYLKPFTFTSKKLIAEVMIPFKNNSKRVKIRPAEFPLTDLDSITVRHGETGYDLIIQTKSGEKILATGKFPVKLKKEPAAGIADSLIFASGMDPVKKNKFKKSFNILNKIKILKVSSADSN